MTMIHIIIPEVLVEVTHSRMVITIHQNFQCIISPQKGHQDLRSQVVASWLSICFCDPMVFTWFCCQSASIIESHELNLLLQHLSGGLQALGKQFNQWRNAPQPLNWGLVRICFCDSIFTDMNIIMTMIPVCFFLRLQTAGRLCYPRARSQSIARASYAPCAAAISYKKQGILTAAQPKAKFCSWAAREEEQRTPPDSISIRRLEALSIPPQKHFDLLVLGQQRVLWHRSFLGKSPQILHYHLCMVGQCACCLFTTNFSGQHVAA